MGTLRYKHRPFPEKGEGLVLERITSLEETSTLGMRQPEEYYASELPSPTQIDSIDGDDMNENVFQLVGALDTGFLDVQADVATVIAGLTSDGEAISPPSRDPVKNT